MTASRPGMVFQLGPGHGLALKFGASLSISRPQFFNLQKEGVGVAESLCDSENSRPERRHFFWLSWVTVNSNCQLLFFSNARGEK